MNGDKTLPMKYCFTLWAVLLTAVAFGQDLATRPSNPDYVGVVKYSTGSQSSYIPPETGDSIFVYLRHDSLEIRFGDRPEGAPAYISLCGNDVSLPVRTSARPYGRDKREDAVYQSGPHHLGGCALEYSLTHLWQGTHANLHITRKNGDFVIGSLHAILIATH